MSRTHFHTFTLSSHFHNYIHQSVDLQLFLSNTHTHTHTHMADDRSIYTCVRIGFGNRYICLTPKWTIFVFPNKAQSTRSTRSTKHNAQNKAQSAKHKAQSAKHTWSYLTVRFIGIGHSNCWLRYSLLLHSLFHCCFSVVSLLFLSFSLSLFLNKT